jgi:protein SCO1
VRKNSVCRLRKKISAAARNIDAIAKDKGHSAKGFYFALGSLLLAVLACAPALAHFPIPPKKSEIGRRIVEKPVANFVLTDQLGRRFQFDGSRGKIVVVNFVYTQCPDVCPLLSAKFASMQRSLDQQKQTGYLFLSITTDPARDNSKTLKSYADLFKADDRRWFFLTGQKETLAKVWKDFGVSVRKAADGEVQHTALTTVIDRQGVRRVDYYGDQWQEKKVLKDIESLAARNQPSE